MLKEIKASAHTLSVSIIIKTHFNIAMFAIGRPCFTNVSYIFTAGWAHVAQRIRRYGISVTQGAILRLLHAKFHPIGDVGPHKLIFLPTF